MTWFIFALLTAFFSATEAALSKKFFNDRSAWEMGGMLVFYSLPIFFVGFLLVETPELNPWFWLTMASFIPLNMLGFHFAFRSIKESDLSLTVPFLAFTPVFVIGTGLLFLGEVPSWWGVLGIALLVAGSYLLGLNGDKNARWYSPFVAIARNKGSVFMLISALIFSVCAPLIKVIIQQSSLAYSATLFFLIHNTLYILLGLVLGRISLRFMLQNHRVGLLIGLIYSCHIFCHFYSVSLVTVAYMIAIKRLNGFFSVVYDALFFGKGRRMGYRFAGAATMGLGAAVIAVLG